MLSRSWAAAELVQFLKEKGYKPKIHLSRSSPSIYISIEGIIEIRLSNHPRTGISKAPLSFDLVQLKNKKEFNLILKDITNNLSL